MARVPSTSVTANPAPARAGGLSRAWAAGVEQVYAVIYPGNAPSVAVTRRLGMTAVGSTSQWYGVELDAFRIARPVAR